MNKAIISGEVSSYGPRIQWTEAGKAQTSLTLVLNKAGYSTYIPCLIVGNKAEEVAETINGGDYLIVEGALSWKAGRTKEAGKLQVVAFDVERITASAQDERTDSGEGDLPPPSRSLNLSRLSGRLPPRQGDRATHEDYKSLGWRLVWKRWRIKHEATPTETASVPE